MPSHRTRPARRASSQRRLVRLASSTPFRQGRFDGLCALYAIINAFRYCLDDEPIYDEIWPNLFSYLVDGLAGETDFANPVLFGLPSSSMLPLLGNAARYMAEEWAIKLSFTRPIEKRRGLTAREAIRELERLGSAPGRGVLLWLRIDRHTRHWTVIETISKRTILLMDSAGYRSVPIGSCVLRGEHKRKANKGEVLLKPRRVFLIQRAD